MTEGTIFLLGPLDFEKQSMYHLTLLANVSQICYMLCLYVQLFQMFMLFNLYVY